MSGKQDDKKRVAPKIVANSAAQIVGLTASFLISLVTFAMVTRYLGPTEYGYYSAALALLLIPAAISDLGLSKTVLRHISREPESTGEVVSASLTARSGIALIAFPMTLALAFVLPLPNGTRMAALVASGGIFLLVLNDGLVSILQAEWRMGWAMMANVMGRVLTLGLTVAVLEVGGGLYAVLLAYVAGNGLTLLVDFVGVRGAGLRVFLDLRYCARLLRGTALVGAAIMMASLYFRIDTVLLAALRPSSDVGLYSSAYKFLDLALVVAGAVIGSLFPHLTRELAKKNTDTSQVQHMFNVLLSFGAAIAVVVWMHAGHLIELGSGSEYLPATTALRLLAPAILVSFVSGLFSGMLLAGHQERLVLLVATVTFVLNVGLNLVLIPAYGYNAAAATTLGTGVAWTVLVVICVRRAFRITVSPSFVPQVAVASAVMVAVLAFCPGPWLLVDACAVAAFVVVLALLPGPGWRYVMHLVEPVLRRRGLPDRKSVTT
jgi:O-antigen/teichoic acid export membrane protein